MIDLVAEQVKIEAKMRDLGAEQFQATYQKWCDQGRDSESKSVRTALLSAVEPLAKAIANFIKETERKKVGRKHSAAPKLKQFEPSQLAYIVLKATLDGFVQERELPKLAIRIGRYLETEERFYHFSQKHSSIANLALKNLNKESLDGAYRLNALNRLMRDNLTEDEEDTVSWTQSEKCLVGIKLIELLCLSTGFLEVYEARRWKKTYRAIRATERFLTWIASLNTQCEIMHPHYLPCVIPPKDWTSLKGGGYHTEALAYPLSLVRTRSRAHKRLLKKADLSLTYRVVNALQQTAWKVNSRVLEAALYLYEQGSGLAGIPSEDLSLPPKPYDIDTNEVSRKAWRQDAARVYDYNCVLASRRILTIKTLTTARDFTSYEAIYFPYHLDFRSRVYSVVTGLSPQGTDLAKGLLTFAKGEAIVEQEAWDWLAIHGANCYGAGDSDFEQRLAFAQEHSARICAIAKEPLDDLWWTKAKNPFCFLAWCFEWAKGVEAKAKGELFYSSLPIAMDGSCNGLQHYAAMLADPVAGEAVNLVPSQKPQDIYERVALSTRERLKELIENGNDEERSLAQQWLDFGIDRSLTKRPVMILPYGGTFDACQKYVYEEVSQRDNQLSKSGSLLAKDSKWVAKYIWEAIDDVVISARLAMAWLRTIAAMVAKDGQAVHWTTPTGFPVYQYYPALKVKRIETALFGTAYHPRIYEEQDKELDKTRHVNGVAPNFVHSLDASALFFTVDEAVKAGIEAFAMVHDSYGTHAAHAPQLARLLRQAFIKLYQGQDVLTNFKQEVIPIERQDEVAEPPFIGGLELKAVAQSAYFFA